MRKFYLIVLVMCSLNTLYGQLLVGRKLGLHVGQVQYERELFRSQHRSNHNVGGNIGGAITFPVKEPFSLHAELLFTSKGKSVTIPEESVKNIGHYYYIEMPIMMRMVIWPEEKVFVGIGPNLSYWTGGNGKVDDLESSTKATSYNIQFGSSESPDDLHVTQPQRLQLGLLFSLGKQFKLQKDTKVTIEARYEMGHSFLGAEDGAYIPSLDFYDNLESKHRLISLNLGYFWTIHKKSKRTRSRTYKAKQRKK